MFSDKIKEECGVFGIYSGSLNADVAMQTYFALFALQHRGQESCGIAVCDEGVITHHRNVGLVSDVFDTETLENLGLGNMAVGHVRYAVSVQRKNWINAQPLVVRHIKGTMAIAHNGSLTNANELREQLELNGAIFHSTNDAEVISYMITKARLTMPSIERAVQAALSEIIGAYSLLVMSPQKIVAARDPQGFRPLCIGVRGDDYLIASESCALESLGADFLRDVEPGEIIMIDDKGLHVIQKGTGRPTGFCVFEFVYFARQDSLIEGVNVHAARQKAGEYLFEEHPAEADIVIGVPESGVDAAIGYARVAGLPHDIGFTKNRYIGRTFINPTSRERERQVGMMINAISSTVKNKRVIMIDDSIVRGNTTRNIVKLLKNAGALEVHVRITAPPFLYPCYFGTDVDSQENLIACKMSIDEIRDHLNADSLAFLSVDGVKKIGSGTGCEFCVGCFTGEYPIAKPSAKKRSDYYTKIRK